MAHGFLGILPVFWVLYCVAMIYMTAKISGNAERMLAELQHKSIMFALKHSVDSAMVPARTNFIRHFKRAWDFRRETAIMRKPGKAYVVPGLPHLKKPASVNILPTADDYFTRMLKGGVEFTKSSGMLVASPKFKLRAKRGRRLRGNPANRDVEYFETGHGGQRNLWRARPRRNQDEYVGPYKSAVVNKPWMEPLNKAQVYMLQEARRRLPYFLRKEIFRALG